MLQEHLLSRLMHLSAIRTATTVFSDSERSSILVPTSSITQHPTLRVQYTSYDVRRAQDTFNPRFNHHFVMVTSGDSSPDHPYWYAKILGIYHANIIWSNDAANHTPRRMEFLWVRWMELVEPGSWDRCELDRVAYIPANTYRDAFGFLDPALVLRAAHLIPAFNFGRSPNPTGHALALDDRTEGDWHSYYVNRLVYFLLTNCCQLTNNTLVLSIVTCSCDTWAVV
jgi:hypothetical protein